MVQVRKFVCENIWIPCNMFVAIPIVGSASGIIQGVFICHILTNSSFKCIYFWSFSVLMLWKLWLLGIGTPIDFDRTFCFLHGIL
jgi:hypothetical protein